MMSTAPHEQSLGGNRTAAQGATPWTAPLGRARQLALMRPAWPLDPSLGASTAILPAGHSIVHSTTVWRFTLHTLDGVAIYTMDGAWWSRRIDRRPPPINRQLYDLEHGCTHSDRRCGAEKKQAEGWMDEAVPSLDGSDCVQAGQAGRLNCARLRQRRQCRPLPSLQPGSATPDHCASLRYNPKPRPLRLAAL